MGNKYLKAIVTLLAVFCIGFGIILIGNVITIGQKIGEATHAYVEYAFYALLGVLAVAFIVVPIWKVICMPSLPDMDVNDGDPIRKTRKLAKRLVGTTENAELKNQIAAAGDDAACLRGLVKSELDVRFGKAREEIIKAASYSFASTSVSQNSTIDTISVLMINCRLVYKVIRASGFRPNIGQLVRIYTNVLSSAFLAHITQSVAEEGGTALVNTFIKGLRNIPLADLVVGSVIDGTINALMTLRVGNLTLSYLKKGAKGHLDDTDMKEANMTAIKSLPRVVGTKFKAVGDFITKFVRSKEPAAETA
jgi:hypothetical protein